MKELSPIDWAVMPLKKYAVFSGRAPRAEYWWFYLATLVVSIPLSIIDGAIGSWSPLSSLFSLATLLPWLAVTVRRLHDTNRSGWWLLALLLPIIAVLVAAVALLGSLAVGGSAASAPSGTAVIFMVVAAVAMLAAGITMLVFMVTEGTAGPNDYGPDPYGPDGLEEVFA